jgi:hypothetical protein
MWYTSDRSGGDFTDAHFRVQARQATEDRIFPGFLDLNDAALAVCEDLF